MKQPITCTRRIQFCCGHRVHLHESKCRNLHGHNYVAFFEAEATPNVDDRTLDDIGRVIDFSVLKSALGGWIDEQWDHGFLLWNEDHQARACVEGMAGQKVFLMPYNPTAENMARYLLYEVAPTALAGTGVRVRKVVIWETENCSAEATL